MRILVVEDDAMNVELFEAALESDHDVFVERDGPAGEARALAERFDLILLDIHLPKRTGIEVLMWGSDFPHSVGSFPDSRQILAELFEGVRCPIEGRLVAR